MRFGKTLKQILDRLDTHTPGGLGDLVTPEKRPNMEDETDDPMRSEHHKHDIINPAIPKHLNRH